MANDLKNTDPESFDLNKEEEKRQLETINLIASENYVSPAVREASSSVFTNKYSEGYPNARYYPGNEYIDKAEELAQKRALALFDLNDNWRVNVQPYSGSPANFAVYTALLRPRASEGQADVVLGMSLPSGGHLTHGHKVSDSGKYFNFIQYGITDGGLIDYEEVEKLAKEHKPKLIVVGASAYSLKIDFARFSAIAKSVNALLMADMAHIAGLVAGGAHPSPFPYCDIVTTTTHKTLRGPRGAMIFMKNELETAINKAVFPGLQGGPHNHTTLALAVALEEASSDEFKKYAEQIVANTKALAEELKDKNFNVVSGGTENHMFLVDTTGKGMSGGEAEILLEQNGITANRNAIPNDTRKPMDPSGIRIGTPAVTTRGMKEEEMEKIAEFIDRALKGEDVLAEVKELALKFPPPGF